MAREPARGAGGGAPGRNLGLPPARFPKSRNGPSRRLSADETNVF
ncbi:hypothetical protein BURMUCGD2_3870 [Burkholderia multivorans CGD2]|uniref:Uncharacterized protein n=1 Tax=Burkholderia multivorans CGD2 TaxID=513052 RepID=B9BUY0_9BURK|nr:hypothetical protein BURMUCGD2_3870 [Burkholderia multivorans CGD2]